ncbi:rhodanese-like domain-containing protein [Phormidium sp. CCY1219]|uniref:rhodanese-like domain-containing protein n=1 Tax=Phormidium sp. CCY1219 TaxID=2886104 RepID=UPI002D1EE025|nr:rhodanese-like domain-containing protein [Phormidium sp. CCY1219]MEB3831453.1 rhodanese-like domain-containing protein [Phormidium sp. CCY1219]
MKIRKIIATSILSLLFFIVTVLGVFSAPQTAAAEGISAGRESLVAEASTAQEEPAFDAIAAKKFLENVPKGYYALLGVKAFKDFRSYHPDMLLVDVRSPAEYTMGHLPDAVNIPLRSLADNLEKIPTDKPVVLYCSSGHRSTMGMTVLQLLGYNNVMSFPPSVNGWKAAGESLTPF